MMFVIVVYPFVRISDVWAVCMGFGGTRLDFSSFIMNNNMSMVLFRSILSMLPWLAARVFPRLSSPYAYTHLYLIIRHL